MSQFPTSLENPAAPSRARANVAVPIPRTGLSADGNVVPQQVLPPVSEGAQLAAELGQTFGLIDNAANAVRQFQDRQAAIAEHEAAQARAQSEFDRKQAATIATAEHGDGQLQAATRLPGILQDIATGKIGREGMSSADQATAIVDSLVKGQPEAWAAGFRQRAQDDIARALTGVDAKLIAANREAALQSFSAGAIGARDAGQMSAAVDGAKSVGGVSELDALEATALSAMKAAAMAGDPQKFKLAADALGPDRFALEQQKLSSLLAESENRRFLDTERKADEAVYRMLNDDRPTESVAYAVGQMRKLGTISERKASQFFGMLKGIDDERARENAKLATIVAEDAFRRDVLQNNVALALHAEATGGMATIREREINLGSKTVKLTESEQRKAATEQGLAMIRDEVLAGTPPEKMTPDQQQQVFAQSAKFLAANGATSPDWSATLAAGFAGADLNALTGDDKVPENVAAGFELWKRLGVMSPQLRDAHVSSEAARRFYDAAELAERYVTRGNPRQSLIEAAKALSREKRGTSLGSTVNAYRLANVVDSISTDGRNAHNGGEVLQTVERLTRFYMDLGLDSSKAVDEAGARFRETHTKVNRWYVPTGGLSPAMREALPAIAEDVAKAYAERFGKDEGVDAEDLTLASDGLDGFVLVNGRTGLMVERAAEAPALAVFTAADLWRMWSERLAATRETATAAELSKGAKTAAHVAATATLTPPGFPGLGAIRAMTANQSNDTPLTDGKFRRQSQRGGIR